MEINFSRSALTRVLVLVLLAVSAAGSVYWLTSNGLFTSWFGESQAAQTVPVDEPALQSLTALYSPSGERLVWEANVCEGMTEKGCQLFCALFAEALWKGVQGKQASAEFLNIAETLKDGSQVWKVNLTTADASAPVYIHVSQNESGKWLLNRVLFSQEAAKYDNQ